MRVAHDSVWATLQVMRERWSFLVLREAFFGVRRFSEMERNLGISKNILSDRLQHLVAEGIMERRQYSERPPLYEYRLTDKGLDLYPATLALLRWGDDWLSEEGGPTLLLRHKKCGETFSPVTTCSECGGKLGARDVTYEPGPGMFLEPSEADGDVSEGPAQKRDLSADSLPIRPVVSPLENES